MGSLARKPQNPTTLSPLQIYLKEVSKYPLLTPEEEYDLAQKHYESGDTAAAHRLITSNLRLVVKIANDFRKIRGEVLDLIQEGNTGLMQAVKRFNPYKEVRLSSYAVWWIRAYILKFLLENEKQVKIATTASQRKLFYNLHKETEKLLIQYERADISMLADKLNVPERDIIEMQKRMSATDISLDAPISTADQSTTLSTGDVIADTRQLPVDTYIAQSQIKYMLREHLQDFAKNLPDRDLHILQSRILHDAPLTLQQIGDRYGITRERARQIEGKIIYRLRIFLHERGLLDASDLEKIEQQKKKKTQRKSQKSKSVKT